MLRTYAANHLGTYFINVKTIFGVFFPLLPRFRDSTNILFLCSSYPSDIIYRATSENYAHICYFKVLVCQHSFCLFWKCFCIPTVILIFPTAIFCLLLLLRDIFFFRFFLSLSMFHIHCFPMYTIKTKYMESWINCLIYLFYFWFCYDL